MAEACESAWKTCGNMMIQGVLVKNVMKRKAKSLKEAANSIKMLRSFAGGGEKKATEESVWRLG